MNLPAGLQELLKQPTHVYITTLMPDGAPQTTMTWVDTDGEHVVINSPAGVLKHRNVLRDPRVSFAVSDPENQRRYFSGRGTVVKIEDDENHAHIDELAHRFMGTDYASMGGDVQHPRVILRIAVDRLHQMG